MALDSKIPHGEMDKKWTDYKGHVKLVNPANKRKLEVIVVGTGLAGASAAASLGELGYKVKAFCFQDSPRRAHSIAAQGGINAAKNYQNDGDSVFRLFYDTVKGGDYRAREAMCIAWRKSVLLLSTSAWRKVFLLPVSMVDY
jgi:succinate dehydrogenase / fumarate reductase flavoprotein subunit